MGLKDQYFDTRIDKIMSHEKEYAKVLAASSEYYRKTRGTDIPEVQKAIIIDGLIKASDRLKGPGMDAYIKSASENPFDVDNPVAVLFSMISILVPNLAYMDAAMVQPQETETSPLYKLNLVAADTRNGVTAGQNLLGADGYNRNNYYSSGRYRDYSLAVTTEPTYKEWTIDLSAYAPLLPGECNFYWNDNGVIKRAVDDGIGGFTGNGISIPNCSIVYSTGAVVIRTDGATSATEDTARLDFRWDIRSKDPAQVIIEFDTIAMESWERIIRSTFHLNNFQAAKKALKNLDIEKLIQEGMTGWINKEMSGSVLQNLASSATLALEWDSAVPSGSEWAFHRLSILQPMKAMSNQIRRNIDRGAGNVFICGDWAINEIENFGSTMWKPNSYSREPIGPYNAGTLMGKYTIIKNQEFDEDKMICTFKASETEASYGVGMFIPLYGTVPYQKDNMNQVQGMSTSFSEKQVFENSIGEITILQ